MTLFYVDGDLATNSLALLTERTLLNVDLLYGSHDGERVFDKSKKDMLELDDRQGGFALRLFW